MSQAMLREARKRVARGWCQGAVARDGDAHAVQAWSADARSWSLLGAILASWHDHTSVEPIETSLDALWRAMKRDRLEVWNDRPGRTQEEVVAAFDRAIALEPPARSQGANESAPKRLVR
jgi:hypothetical protein